jgi:ribitol-5-phosphate 2-dehydrogenase (NADP+) / D-ribitol-5-phosphate cytidylyltransferase
MHTVKAIILASGSSSRFNDSVPKQFVKLAGLPVIVHTLKTFESCSRISGIVVVTQEEYIDEVWNYASNHNLRKIDKVVVGGATRQESSRIGLECCGDDTDYVLIHDGVRPFVTHLILDALIDAVIEHRAVDTVIQSADTLVEIDPDGFIVNIPERSRFRRGQTPQAFEYKLIRMAHERARTDGLVNATDDCFLVHRLGQKVLTVPGDEQNIKITFPLDLHLADKLFQLKTHTPLADDPSLSVLHGKVFLVVGGTSGIGASLCEKLRNVSNRVYSFSRCTQPPVDICRIETIQAAVDHVLGIEGRIDYAINCAGDLIRKNVEFTSVDEWRHIYDCNINGSFYFAKILTPVLRKQNGGALMFVGSSSYTRGRGGYAAYSSSKSALVNFCQALAEELADSRISVNLVSPGRVRTPLRFRNFGNEEPGTLLEADHVAEMMLKALTTETTGSVFEVR